MEDCVRPGGISWFTIFAVICIVVGLWLNWQISIANKRDKEERREKEGRSGDDSE